MFKNEEGFSLLELVVAVGVAGIIAAVALPTFAGLQDKATTTSATYAASASAAEALANSTIGTSGSVNSGASSSINSALSGVNASFNDFTPTGYVMATFGGVLGWDSIPAGTTGDWATLDAQRTYADFAYIELGGISQAKADALIAAIDAGATNLTLNGWNYTVVARNTIQYDSAIGNYKIVSNKYDTQNSYGAIVMHIQVAPNANPYINDRPLSSTVSVTLN